MRCLWCSCLSVDIVKFIPRYLENAYRDVLPAILMKSGKTVDSFSSSQEQSVALQGIIVEHRMTWFLFAQLLLKSKASRPYIYKIAEYTRGE